MRDQRASLMNGELVSDQLPIKMAHECQLPVIHSLNALPGHQRI